MTEGIIKIGIDQIVEIEEFSFSGQSIGRPRYEQNYWNDYRKGNFRGNMRMYEKFGRQNRGRYRGKYRNENL